MRHLPVAPMPDHEKSHPVQINFFTAQAIVHAPGAPQHDMKKASMKMADQDIPEFKRDELGKGVKGFAQETKDLTARASAPPRRFVRLFEH